MKKTISIIVTLFVSSLLLMPGISGLDEDGKLTHSEQAMLGDIFKDYYRGLAENGVISQQEKATLIMYINTGFWDDYYSDRLYGGMSMDPRGMSMGPELLQSWRQNPYSLTIGLHKRMIGVGGLGSAILGAGFACFIVSAAVYAGCMSGCVPPMTPPGDPVSEACIDYCQREADIAFLNCISAGGA